MSTVNIVHYGWPHVTRKGELRFVCLNTSIKLYTVMIDVILMLLCYCVIAIPHKTLDGLHG